MSPGYILGGVQTEFCNIDSFLIRTLKGCINFGDRPRILNTFTAVPVNDVARSVVAAALNRLSNGLHIVLVTGRSRLHMNEQLFLLEYFAYELLEIDYNDPKPELEKYTSAGWSPGEDPRATRRYAVLIILCKQSTNQDKGAGARRQKHS